MKSRFLPPHTGQSSTTAGGFAAVFAAAAGFLAVTLRCAVWAVSSTPAIDKVSATQIERMFRLDA